MEPSAKPAHLKASTSIPSPWPASFPSTCAATASSGSSKAGRQKTEDGGRKTKLSVDRTCPLSSMSERERNQGHGSYDHAPPGKQRETMALDVFEKRFHHDPRTHERDDEAESDHQNI